jgi:hypothetical protein
MSSVSPSETPTERTLSDGWLLSSASGDRPKNVDYNRTNANPRMVASVPLDPTMREVVDGTVTVRLDGPDKIKDAHIGLVSQSGNTATIDYGFNGFDKNFVGDCPGGGHATVLAVFPVRQQIPIE